MQSPQASDWFSQEPRPSFSHEVRVEQTFHLFHMIYQLCIAGNRPCCRQ